MIGDETVLAVIPARGGSKGLHKKNLAQVGGQSLVELAIGVAKGCEEIDQIVVSTDSPEIAAHAERLGAPVGELRPPHLAQDETSAIDVANFVIEQETARAGFEPDILVWLEPTSPLRRISDISNMLWSLASQPEADAVVSVARLRHDPTVLRVLRDSWLVPFDSTTQLIERRQDSREVWFPFGVAYVCRVRSFRDQQTFYPAKTLGYEIERFQEFEIDDIYDLLATDALKGWMAKNGK